MNCHYLWCQNWYNVSIFIIYHAVTYVSGSYISAWNWISCSGVAFRLIFQLCWHAIRRNNFVPICRASCHLLPRFPNITTNWLRVTRSQLLHVSQHVASIGVSVFGSREKKEKKKTEAKGDLNKHEENIQKSNRTVKSVRCNMSTLALFEKSINGKVE